MDSAELMDMMRLLARIVVEHQQRNTANNSPKVLESCNYIRLDQTGGSSLIDKLCREGYVAKGEHTGLLTPTDKGINEVSRYLRIVEQKL